MLTPREIIAESWSITIREPNLRRWGFVAALFETLRSVELMLYQGYYLYFLVVKNEVANWLSFEVFLFKNVSLWIFISLLVFTLLLLILELFIPTLATGAIIGLAAKSHRKEPCRGGLVLALYNFLPLLEIHGLFILSSFAVIFTCFSLILRYSIDSPFMRFSGLILLAMIAAISILFHFFAGFSEEAVVIRKVGIFAGIGQSFKLIVSYLSHIMFLILLMLVISVRIVINTVLLLLIPALAIGLGMLLFLILPGFVSILIASLFGMILLILASYFLAYLHVFKQTVWTLTYMELSAEKDLDVIE